MLRNSIVLIVFLSCIIEHSNTRPTSGSSTCTCRCKKKHKPKPKFGVTDRCRHERGRRLSFSPASGAWVEELPDHITAFDRCGNVIQKLQFWRFGCWTIIERCNWNGEICLPGSKQKLKHASCTWGPGCRAPSRRQLRLGYWVSFPGDAAIKCPKDQQQEKHRISDPNKPDDQPKKGRVDAANPRETESGKSKEMEAATGKAGTSSAGTNENKECFMKNVRNNNIQRLLQCDTAEKAELISLVDIVDQSAHYTEVPVDNEADLVLSRGDGIFHWNDQSLDNMFICKRHYNILGRGWSRIRPYTGGSKGRTGLLKCAVPPIPGLEVHSDPVRAHPYTYITKEESEILLSDKGVFAPLGTGMNSICPIFEAIM